MDLFLMKSFLVHQGALTAWGTVIFRQQQLGELGGNSSSLFCQDITSLSQSTHTSHVYDKDAFNPSLRWKSPFQDAAS